MKKLLIFILPVLMSSCILVPFVDSFKQAGLTPSDRRALLGKNVKSFHDAMHWGNINEAIHYADTESTDKITDYLQENAGDEEKIVESKVKSTKFDDGAYTATIEVKTKAYKIPVYVVQERVEREVWKWSMVGEWRLTDIERVVKKF
jgi:hypothetical protein